MSHKLHVTIRDDQYRELHARSAETGASIGELVRRALKSAHRTEQDRERRLAAFDQGFGAWSKRPASEDTYAEIRKARPRVRDW